jgi:hypothetical protein
MNGSARNLLHALLAGAVLVATCNAALAQSGGCSTGKLRQGGAGENIQINRDCKVSARDSGPGEFNYGAVTIQAHGRLVFDDANIEFKAKSIVIQNGGELMRAPNRRRSARPTRPIA